MGQRRLPNRAGHTEQQPESSQSVLRPVRHYQVLDIDMPLFNNMKMLDTDVSSLLHAAEFKIEFAKCLLKLL